jgi:hypothetical protein
MSPEVYRLSPLEECVGPLNGLEVKRKGSFHTNWQNFIDSAPGNGG